MRKNIIESIVGIIIGGAFLYFTLVNKPLNDIFGKIATANVGWIVISGLLLIFTFYLRALRWKILLTNSGAKAKTLDVLYSVVLAYFVNSFTPKFGEVVRCTSLKKSSDIPMAKSLGTVVSERIYDVIVLAAGLITIFLIEYERLKTVFAQAYDNIAEKLSQHTYLIIIVLVGMLIAVVLLYMVAKKIKIYQKIKGFIKETISTIKSTFRIKEYGKFIVLTASIWGVLILMNYIFLKALPETNGSGLYFALVVLFVGGIGWALPSPGGIGTTHFFILHLFLLFNMGQESGLAYGILSNGVTFVLTILFGLLSIIAYKIYRKKRTQTL